MTKEMYFEMCDQLGTDPIEEEIPVELNDFPELVQTCFIMYNYLTDNWDSMGGNYLGKDYSIVFNLFDVYNVDITDRLLSLEFLQRMDSIRSNIVSEKIKQRTPQK